MSIYLRQTFTVLAATFFLIVTDTDTWRFTKARTSHVQVIFLPVQQLQDCLPQVRTPDLWKRVEDQGLDSGLKMSGPWVYFLIFKIEYIYMISNNGHHTLPLREIRTKHIKTLMTCKIESYWDLLSMSSLPTTYSNFFGHFAPLPRKHPTWAWDRWGGASQKDRVNRKHQWDAVGEASMIGVYQLYIWWGFIMENIYISMYIYI